VTLHAEMPMTASQRYHQNFELDINVYYFENWLFSVVVSLQRRAHFYHRKTWYMNFKPEFLPHYWSDNDFKGTIVNRTLPSLHRESIKITLKVNFIKIFILFTIASSFFICLQIVRISETPFTLIRSAWN